jgi:nicotinamide mononucleotide transporter
VNEFIEGFEKGLIETSTLEWLAVAMSIVYVILAAKEKIICWLFAFLSSVLFVYICFNAKLYVESVLNIFYVAMAMVGFLLWNKNRNEKVQIIKWAPSVHIINISVSLLMAFLLGFVLDIYTDQAKPYVDSFTTIFALAATFMISRKVLNNWLYWIVIDGVSVYLFSVRQLELVACLNILYIALATYAWFQWRKQFNKQEI